jgi:hypothetical protein
MLHERFFDKGNSLKIKNPMFKIMPGGKISRQGFQYFAISDSHGCFPNKNSRKK